MSTVATRKPPVKPVRTVRVTLTPSADNPLLGITITGGRKADDYLVLPIPSAWGEAFEVQKLTDPRQPTYHVHLDRQGQTCECKGFLHRGHCRHLEVLTALREHVKL